MMYCAALKGSFQGFRIGMALFAMGAMTLFQGAFWPLAFIAMAPIAFFQVKTLKMGIVAAQGE